MQRFASVIGMRPEHREEYERLRRFVEIFMPERVDAIELYQGAEPIFDAYGIEDEIQRAQSRKVPLPSGGHLIIDQAEALIRYLEVELSAETGAAGRHVLVPLPMAILKKSNRPVERQVKVDSILAKQFSGVPQLSNPTSVTVDEEERIAAYYGGGLLYATPGRTEPLL